MARENESRNITICSKRPNPKGETVLVSPFGKEVAVVAQCLSLGKMEEDHYQKFLAGDSFELSVTIPEAEKITRVIYYRSHKDEKNKEYGEYYYAENISKETFTKAAGIDFLPGRYKERLWGLKKGIENFLESEEDDWVKYQDALWKVWKDLYKAEGRTDETYDALMQFHYQSLGKPVPGGEGTVKVESSATSAAAQDPDDTIVHVDKDGNYTMGGMFLCKSVEIYKVLCALYADGGTDDAADDRIKAFFGAFKRLFKSALRAKSGGNQNASDRDFLELILKLMKFSDDRISKVLKVLYPPKSDEKTAASQKAPETEPQKQAQQPAPAASDGKSDSKASAQPQPKPKSKVKGFSTPVKIDEGRKVSLATVEKAIGKIDDVIDGKLKSTFPLTDDLIGKLYRAQKALKDVIKEAEMHKGADGKSQPLTHVGAKYLNEQVKFMNPEPEPDDNFAFIDDDGERYGIVFTE